MDAIALFAPDPQTTDLIAQTLVPFLVPGDVVALQGGLGAGKSALARAIIRARLDAPDLDVPSPSFALVQPYGDIVHADLYRLTDEHEVAELGLFDDETAILIVEWPERAPGLLAHKGLTITLSIPGNGEGRNIEITGRGGRDMADISRAMADLRTRA